MVGDQSWMDSSDLEPATVEAGSSMQSCHANLVRAVTQVAKGG